jgi:hypothetical protein
MITASNASGMITWMNSANRAMEIARIKNHLSSPVIGLRN